MRAVVVAALVAGGLFAQDSSLESLFRSAVEAQQRGDLDTAVRDYRKAIHLRPDFFDAQANLGVALVHLGKFDDAIQAYRAALKIEPSNDAVRMNLALAFYKKGDWKSAADELARLAREKPADP